VSTILDQGPVPGVASALPGGFVLVIADVIYPSRAAPPNDLRAGGPRGEPLNGHKPDTLTKRLPFRRQLTAPWITHTTGISRPSHLVSTHDIQPQTQQ
jgi:hypothetical protein